MCTWEVGQSGTREISPVPLLYLRGPERYAAPYFPEFLAFFPYLPCSPLTGIRAGPGLSDLGSFGDGPLLGPFSVPMGPAVDSRHSPLSGPARPLSLLCLPSSHCPSWPLLCSVHLHLPLA